MNSDSWSILLSILGLALGFVSAYGQIKRFFLTLLRFSGESITQWASARTERVRILTIYPSALVAYLARSFLFITATTLAALVLLGFLRGVGGIPDWLLPAIRLVFGAAIGAELGSLHTTILSVSKRTLQLASADKADG